MVESPLSDILIRIKNGYLAGKKTVTVPYSKIIEKLAKILLGEGYLAKLEIVKEQSIKTLQVDLKYHSKRPAMEEVKIISKPSLKTYVKKKNIPLVLGGRGLVVISTPQGLMTGREARKKGLGGEIICEIW